VGLAGGRARIARSRRARVGDKVAGVVGRAA
jgi:hypothetical protein